MAWKICQILKTQGVFFVVGVETFSTFRHTRTHFQLDKEDDDEEWRSRIQQNGLESGLEPAISCSTPVLYQAFFCNTAYQGGGYHPFVNLKMKPPRYM